MSFPPKPLTKEFNFPLPTQRAFIMYSEAYFLIFYSSPSERGGELGYEFVFRFVVVPGKWEENAFPNQPTGSWLSLKCYDMWTLAPFQIKFVRFPRHLHPQNDDGLELNFPSGVLRGEGGKHWLYTCWIFDQTYGGLSLFVLCHLRQSL